MYVLFILVNIVHCVITRLSSGLIYMVIKGLLWALPGLYLRPGAVGCIGRGTGVLECGEGLMGHLLLSGCMCVYVCAYVCVCVCVCACVCVGLCYLS